MLDRRQHARHAMLLKAQAAVGSGAIDVVCVNAGPGGGYFVSRI